MIRSILNSKRNFNNYNRQYNNNSNSLCKVNNNCNNFTYCRHRMLVKKKNWLKCKLNARPLKNKSMKLRNCKMK